MGGCGVFMGVLVAAAGALVGVGVASEPQANTAIATATVAVNSIKTLMRLIETPCKIKLCTRPAKVSREVSIRGPRRVPLRRCS